MFVFRSHLRALALQPVRSAFSLSLSFFFHLFALAVVSRLAHWPLWSAPLILGAFCLPPLALRRRFPEALAPLALVYLLAVVRLGIVYGLRQEVPALLGYEWALGLAAAWAALIWLNALRQLRWAWFIAALGFGALMVYLLWVNRPAGVTGSDPFAYVQMALDLAQRGTPLHQFPLAPFAANLGLPALPTTHVGYVLPDAQGFAPTVWPPGYSMLLALAYRTMDVTGMLSFNIIVGMAGLVLTGALTALVCPPRWQRLPLALGTGAAIVLATSPEQLTRLVVPLADGAAQLFTTLAVVTLLYATRLSLTRPYAYALAGAFAGLALALAYSIRYTQVLILPGLLLMAWIGFHDSRSRRNFLAGFLLAAALGALPDLWYRTQTFGAPWRFGSGELGLFAWGALSEAASRLGGELFAWRELGWLWPSALVGAAYLWRRQRRAAVGLLAVYVPLLAFHLWYPFLRLRDLLSLLPLLAALCAVGGAAVLFWLWRRGTVIRLLTVTLLLGLSLLRLSALTDWFGGGFYTFGYLRAEQMQGLREIAAFTPPEAVVASSLNSGAVEMYGQRQTVRPGNLLQPGLGWSAGQWADFVAALRATGRPLCLLMDSPEMDEPLATVRQRFTVQRVLEINVPVYQRGGSSQNLTVPLYCVQP